MNTGLLRHAVATALTVYGIETKYSAEATILFRTLQQHLPFTVLKPEPYIAKCDSIIELQQHLPFTVLKRYEVRR